MSLDTSESDTRLQLTIASLPDEILEQVMELSLSPTSVHSRYAHLTSLCLVSRLFSSLAQPMLWRDIYLYHDSTARKLLASYSALTRAQRQMPTRQLRIFGDLNWDGVENDAAKEILEACEGVGNASLYFFDSMSAALLECRGLRDIHTLRLSSNVGSDHVCGTLPFQNTLTSLTLSTFTYPPTVLHSLLSCPNITHLDLLTYGGSRSSLGEAFLAAFPPCAPKLLSLSLPPRTNPAFLPLLSLCTSLESLTTDERIPSMILATLKALPSVDPTLKRWSTAVCDFSKLEVEREGETGPDKAAEDFWDQVLDSVALSNMETLTLRGVGASDMARRSHRKCVVNVEEQ